MANENPTHVAGFQIHTAIEFGAFGRSYVGFHSQEGRKILKILRDGEDVGIAEDEFAKLKEDPSLLHAEPRHQQDGNRVLVGHFIQAASLGLLALGSDLQKGCEKTLADLDPNGDCANMLRQATLQQRAELVKSIAQRIEQLHNEKKTFPYVTPWNVMLSDGRTKLVDLGLAYQPEKLDLNQVPEDVLAYYAPEVVRCLAEKKPVQVSPAADVYALALTARSILLRRVVEVEGTGSAPAAPPAGGAAPAAGGFGKREALVQGKSWKRLPQEEISRKLDDLLVRGAAREPGRRPTAAQFVKELDGILRDKQVAWTPPSPLPKIVAGVAAVVVVAGATVFALLPDPVEKLSRVEYAKATASSSAADRLAAVSKAEKELVLPDKKGTLPEFGRLKAIALLEDAAKNPQAAVDALRAYAARPVNEKEGDALAARFLAAFIQKWALLDQVESRKELEQVAAATPPDAASKTIPTLATVALKVAPFGVEGDLKLDDAKKWLEDVRLASTDENSALRCAWSTSGGYEKIEPAPRPIGFKAEWAAKLLLGRLKDVVGDDGETSLKEGKDAFPAFGAVGAHALHVAKVAKDEASFTAARGLIGEAKKLKKDAWTWGEGELALADLAFRAAAASKEPVKAYREAAKAYEAAAKEKPATDKLDLTAACKRGKLLAGLQLGLAVAQGIAKDPGTSVDAALLREAETALTEVVEAASDKAAAKDDELQGFAADAHVALGLVLMNQPNRSVESFDHLGYVYAEQDVTKGYRKADSPANPPTSKLFFDYYKGQFFALAASDGGKVDTDKQQQLLTKIDALAKLEKFDLSWISLANAKVHRRSAMDMKPGKKRTDAFLAARAAFEAVFSSTPDSWQEAVEGRLDVSLALVRDSDDATAAGAYLGDAQAFLDKASEELKKRKVSSKDSDKVLNPLKANVRKEWFAVLAKWLASRGDSVDLSNENDLAFAKKVCEIAEAPGPELDAATKALVAQVHFIQGKWQLDQKLNLSEAVMHLAQAVVGLGEEKKALASQAALLAAEVALTKAGEVREGPWGTDAKAAAKWGRDLLAKREGFQNYDALARAIKENKIPAVWPDLEAAKRLVQDILKNAAAVTVEDAAFAARISPQSPLAHLLLARGRSATGAKPEARAEAQETMKFADAQKEPDLIVEAARIYFVNTPEADVSSSEFKGVVDRAESLMGAAASKWKGSGDAKLPDAFACLYWKGRYFQQKAEEGTQAGAVEPAKKDFKNAVDAYVAFVKACQENGANQVSEAQDLDERKRNCILGSGQ